jgi:PAS domain S-box-containing protein
LNYFSSIKIITHDIYKAVNPSKQNLNCEKVMDEFFEITEINYDIIFEVDLKQRFEYISPEIKSILGYNAYEMISKKFNKFVLITDLPIADDAFQVALSGKSTKFQEIQAISKDGINVPLEIKLIPISDNQKVIGVHGVARVIAHA